MEEMKEETRERGYKLSGGKNSILYIKHGYFAHRDEWEDVESGR